MDLSNTVWAQRELKSRQPRYAFSAATRIRPIIIITFGTTNVVDYSIRFGSGICMDIGDRSIVIFSNHAQSIKLHMVPQMKDLNLKTHSTTRHRI